LQCPSGVDVSKLMATARAQYVKRKGLHRTEWLLGHNRYLSAVGSTFGPLSNFFMRLPGSKWLLEKTTGLDRRRSMPSFARGSFLKAGRQYLNKCKSLEKPIDKVAYFVDTYANYNDHALGFAVLNVLRCNNIEVILPKQRPAPQPAIVYGDAATARRDLSYNVKHLAEVVRNGYKIVCSEPSAALCLKEELRHFVEGDDARLISENTYELMNYLYVLFKEGKLKSAKMESDGTDMPLRARIRRAWQSHPPEKNRLLRRDAPRNDRVTEFVYHLPCHLAVVGDSQASVKLLRELCGIEVVDLRAGCCGLAGTFGMQKKNYELSSQIAANLKEVLESSPIKNVLTECAACKMQIEHISDCVVKHPIKVLAERYELP
jgi:Fe-S oxidoreductase